MMEIIEINKYGNVAERGWKENFKKGYKKYSEEVIG